MFCDRNVETHLLLRDPWIVLNIPQKHHTLPADVLPSASEDLFVHFIVYLSRFSCLSSIPDGNPRDEENFVWPTPRETSDGWIAELAHAISPQNPSGTKFKDLAPKLNTGNYLNEAFLKSILDNSLPDNTESLFVYSKLQKIPHL